MKSCRIWGRWFSFKGCLKFVFSKVCLTTKKRNWHGDQWRHFLGTMVFQDCARCQQNVPFLVCYEVSKGPLQPGIMICAKILGLVKRRKQSNQFLIFLGFNSVAHIWFAWNFSKDWSEIFAYPPVSQVPTLAMSLLSSYGIISQIFFRGDIWAASGPHHLFSRSLLWLGDFQIFLPFNHSFLRAFSDSSSVQHLRKNEKVSEKFAGMVQD